MRVHWSISDLEKCPDDTHKNIALDKIGEQTIITEEFPSRAFDKNLVLAQNSVRIWI